MRGFYRDYKLHIFIWLIGAAAVFLAYVTHQKQHHLWHGQWGYSAFTAFWGAFAIVFGVVLLALIIHVIRNMWWDRRRDDTKR